MTEFQLLSPGDGPLVEQLFGANGACGGCWCMHWRIATHGKAWKEAQGEPNRAALMGLIAAGAVHAVLAISGGAPVGWCCFGPKHGFPRLIQTKGLQRETAGAVWSIVCLFLTRGARRQGIGTGLIRAATEAAFEAGAEEVEGYPVPTIDGKTVPAAFAWTGVPAQYAACGFNSVGPAGGRLIHLRAVEPSRPRKSPLPPAAQD